MRAPLALVLAAISLPAAAQSTLGPADVGRAFCAALVADDMAPVGELLAPELAGLITVGKIRWASGQQPASSCMPVGASGSAEHPESVLFLTFADGTSASDKLVLSFVSGQLRIDDVVFGMGGTL